MINTAYIGKAIREYCDATGQTNVDLAKMIGVDKSTIGRWINGKAREIKPAHWIALKGLINSHLAKTVSESKTLEEIIIEDIGLSPSAKLRIIDIIRKDRTKRRDSEERKG